MQTNTSIDECIYSKCPEDENYVCSCYHCGFPTLASGFALYHSNM